MGTPHLAWEAYKNSGEATWLNTDRGCDGFFTRWTGLGYAAVAATRSCTSVEPLTTNNLQDLRDLRDALNKETCLEVVLRLFDIVAASKNEATSLIRCPGSLRSMRPRVLSRVP